MSSDPTAEQMSHYPRWLRRSIVITVFVPAMLYTVISRVWREVRTIPFYVCCDLRENWADAKRWWR